VTIEELSKSEGIWGSEESDNDDIVLKSSIRFIRNIGGYVFPRCLSGDQRDKVAGSLIKRIEENEDCTDSSFINLQSCSPVDRHILFERNIINDMIHDNGDMEKSTLVLSKKQNHFYLLNVRDHLQLIINHSGFHFKDIYIFGKKTISKIEDGIGFAFTAERGYLTSNPDFSGSGIEMSATLHLAEYLYPGTINEIIVDLKKRGLALKSSWIDGYYVIVTGNAAGMTDKSVYDMMTEGLKETIEKERKVREEAYDENRTRIEDRVWRSYGLLLSCRTITLFEALDLLSQVRFGVSLGIIGYLTIKDINVLLYYIQDSHLVKRYGLAEGDGSLENMRAQFIRNYLKEVL